MKRGMAVGLDVGGTFAKVAVLTPGGKMLKTLRLATAPRRGPRDFTARACAEVRRLERVLGRRLLSLGIGIAGDVDGERGVLRFSPNLKAFAGFHLRRAFERSLKVPVSVDNDANMAAWGGYVRELGRRPKNAACITLGTGIGGGLILDGRLYRGSTGTAGEIGHMCVEADGELCRCGSRGCLEAYAGAYGIIRLAEKLSTGPSGKRLDGLTPKLLARAARRGDRAAKAAWGAAGYYLGLGISNLVCLLNLDHVLLVGGMSGAGSLILAPIRKVLRSNPFKTPFRHVRVTIARTPDLGALGAALSGLGRLPSRRRRS